MLSYTPEIQKNFLQKGSILPNEAIFFFHFRKNNGFTFRIYVIYKGKYWFHFKNLEKIFLLKTCFLPIKNHKT
jgi:hypothetical protein